MRWLILVFSLFRTDTTRSSDTMNCAARLNIDDAAVASRAQTATQDILAGAGRRITAGGH
jgi:hypothetical protein